MTIHEVTSFFQTLGNVPRISLNRHHSGHDQNALKLKKTGSEKKEKASPLTILVDNINKYRDENHVIIGEEWG